MKSARCKHEDPGAGGCRRPARSTRYPHEAQSRPSHEPHETLPEPRAIMRILRCVAVATLALLAGLQPARAQADDGSNVNVAILDVLRARGIIDQAQYEELLAMARATVDRERGEIDLIQGRLERLRAPDLQTSGGTPGKLMFK